MFVQNKPRMVASQASNSRVSGKRKQIWTLPARRTKQGSWEDLAKFIRLESRTGTPLAAKKNACSSREDLTTLIAHHSEKRECHCWWKGSACTARMTHQAYCYCIEAEIQECLLGRNKERLQQPGRPHQAQSTYTQLWNQPYSTQNVDIPYPAISVASVPTRFWGNGRLHETWRPQTLAKPSHSPHATPVILLRLPSCVRATSCREICNANNCIWNFDKNALNSLRWPTVFFALHCTILEKVYMGAKHSREVWQWFAQTSKIVVVGAPQSYHWWVSKGTLCMRINGWTRSPTISTPLPAHWMSLDDCMWPELAKN